MKTNLTIKPEAYISVGKNRRKVFSENTVYLENKSEFEFEFFNPTSNNVKALIINGNLISNRGLVLRPGTRGFIERYIDEDRKFLFETYFVDGQSKAVQKAIEDNGTIKIEFFKEYQRPKPVANPWITQQQTTIYRGIVSSGAISYNTSNLSNTTGSGEATLDSASFLSLGDCDSKGFSASDDVPVSSTFNMKLSRSKVASAAKTETGRIEKGDASGQRFSEVSMDFDLFPFHTVEYKLLPMSQKPLEMGELKLKCKKCEAKIKSHWKVCPICAHPIDNESNCPNCNVKVEPAWNFCPNCNNQLK